MLDHVVELTQDYGAFTPPPLSPAVRPRSFAFARFTGLGIVIDDSAKQILGQGADIKGLPKDSKCAQAPAPSPSRVHVEANRCSSALPSLVLGPGRRTSLEMNELNLTQPCRKLTQASDP